MFAIRIILFIVVGAGLVLLMERLTGFGLSVVPFYLNCAVGCLMVVAGVLNIMLPVLLLLVGAGIYGLMSGGHRLKEIGRKHGATLLVMIAVTGYFAVYFSDAFFVEYDDVSHWAYIVKVMLSADAQPSFQNPIPGHFSYPTGMAGVLYVACRILGRSDDGLLMFLQLMVMLSCFPVLSERFVAVKREKKAWMSIAVLVAVGLLTLSELSLLWLRVDAVVGMLTMGGAFLLAQEKNKLMEQPWLLLPVTCFLPLVKTSGLLMTMLLLGAMYVMMSKQERRVKWTRMAFLAGGGSRSGYFAVEQSCFFGISERHAEQAFHLYTSYGSHCAA